jgi:hypothetical protein
MKYVYYVYEWLEIDGKDVACTGGIFDTEEGAWNACVNDNMLYCEVELNKPLKVGAIESMPDVHPFSKVKFNVEKDIYEPYELIK